MQRRIFLKGLLGAALIAPLPTLVPKPVEELSGYQAALQADKAGIINNLVTLSCPDEIPFLKLMGIQGEPSIHPEFIWGEDGLIKFNPPEASAHEEGVKDFPMWVDEDVKD